MSEIPIEFVAAAAALAPTLQLFDSLEGRAMSGVWLRHDQGSLAEVVIEFGGIYLAAIAEEDYDTLKIEIRRDLHAASLTDAKLASPWRPYLGQSFGWGWLVMNQQGYVDGALLGFGDDIYPKIALTVLASEIKVGAINF